MMKVFIVGEYHGFDGAYSILGIYDNRLKAEQRVEEVCDPSRTHFHAHRLSVFVNEMEVQ